MISSIDLMIHHAFVPCDREPWCSTLCHSHVDQAGQANTPWKCLGDRSEHVQFTPSVAEGATLGVKPGPIQSLGDPLGYARGKDRLAEIEARVRAGCPSHEIKADGHLPIDYVCQCFEDFADDGLSLIAEVRRLRRENHLLHLSRGSTDDAGTD